MSDNLLRANTHHPYTIGVALISIPLWAALYVAHEYYGDISQWRPWLMWTAKGALSGDDWKLAWQVGAVGGLALFALCFWLFDGMFFGAPSATTSHGDARWAERKDIKKAKLFSDWGIVIGKMSEPENAGAYLRVQSDKQGTVLVSGPPRSGKGVGIIVPTLLEYPGSFIAYDVKGELYAATARKRLLKNNKVFVLAPFPVHNSEDNDASLYGQSHGFNPLEAIAGMSDLEDRLTEISALGDAFLSPKSRGTTEESLMEDAHGIFKAAAAIVCNEPDPHMGRILEILTPVVTEDGKSADYKQMFAALAERAPDPLSANALLRLSGQDNKQLGIYMSVLMGGGLKAWEAPAIVRATRKNDIDLEGLRWSATSIYIAIPEAYKDTAKPLVRLFIQSAINAMRKRLVKRGEDFLPVLFMIDEFHSLGKMQGVLDAVTTLPGYGGRMCLVVQSPSSLREHYGQSGEEILTESAHVHVWLTPNEDTTKQKLSRALGTRTIVQKSFSGKTRHTKPTDSHSESYSERGRELMRPEEVGRLDEEEIIITGKSMFPIRTHRVTYYRDIGFKSLDDSQKGQPWPEIPYVKSGAVTSYYTFLDGVGNTAEDESANAAPATPLSKQAAAKGPAPEEQHSVNPVRPTPTPAPAREPEPAPEPAPEPEIEDDYADFDAGAEPSDEGTFSDMIASVHQDGVAAGFDDLTKAAPLDPETDSAGLVKAAKALTPDEVIARLSM